MKNDFYELRGDVSKAVNGLNSLKDNPEEAMKFFEANKDLIKLKTQVNAINNQLTKLRAYEKYIRDLPESKMTGAEKKEKLDAMKKNENAMLRNANMLRKLAYDDTALQNVISEDEFEEGKLEYDLPNSVYFFTNRVELGSLSVYKELDLVSKLHGSVTEQ